MKVVVLVTESQDTFTVADTIRYLAAHRETGVKLEPHEVEALLSMLSYMSHELEYLTQWHARPINFGAFRLERTGEADS
jgi:hypothetical protein